MSCIVAKDKRQGILDAALTLFTLQGFDGTSTAAIAKQAAVATGTLFHHFPSKQELINQLYLHIKAELAEGLPDWRAEPELDLRGLQQAIKGIWQHTLGWFIERPLQLRFFAQYIHSPYINSQTQQRAEQQLLAVITEALDAGQRLGIFKPLPLPLLYQMAQGLLLHSAFYYIEQRRLPTGDESEEMANVVWQALLA
jgi:AcrR family transcriptional regulator